MTSLEAAHNPSKMLTSYNPFIRLLFDQTLVHIEGKVYYKKSGNPHQDEATRRLTRPMASIAALAIDWLVREKGFKTWDDTIFVFDTLDDENTVGATSPVTHVVTWNLRTLIKIRRGDALVSMDMMIAALLANIIHEYTHVSQASTGRLFSNGTTTTFDGVEYQSESGVMEQLIKSEPGEERDRLNSIYENLPWEKEAEARSDELFPELMEYIVQKKDFWGAVLSDEAMKHRAATAA